MEGRVVRRSIGDRALEARQAVLQEMQGKPHALWVDNFNSMRYVVDPLVSMQVLNATAVAVLPLRAVPFAEPWSPPSPMELVRAVPLAVEDVLRYGSVMRALVSTVMTRGPPQGRVRVPLDVPREGPIQVKWQPWGLLRINLGVLEDFVRVFPAVATLQEKSGHVTPVLVDEKVYHQMMRCVHGVG